MRQTELTTRDYNRLLVREKKIAVVEESVRITDGDNNEYSVLSAQKQVEYNSLVENNGGDSTNVEDVMGEDTNL